MGSRLDAASQIIAMELLDRLTAALPVPARLTPEVQASLRSGNAAKTIPAICTITGLHYMGDEGGILCKLDPGPKVENKTFVSITHLRFDARLPMARAITTYQKHRVKRLSREPT